jgi:hypothetical protein
MYLRPTAKMCRTILSWKTRRHRGFDTSVTTSQKVLERAKETTQAGVKLYDCGDYSRAAKKLKETRVLWPQNDSAHYEYGLTLFA